MQLKKHWLDNNKPVAILSSPNEGKTNLMFYFASLFKQDERNKYVLGYPKEVKGFTTLSSTDDFGRISNAILLIDEISNYFPVWERRSNERLLNLLKFCEHNRIKLIFTSQNSQDVTKQCEALISCWAIKQINVHKLKNGSTPSYCIKHVIKHPNVNREFIKVQKNEFIWYNEYAEPGEVGIYEFPNMNIGKDWANENTDKNNEKNNKIIATKKSKVVK